uniref:Thymic stromal lymphopoietin n=1 Tax=Bos indicus x Bos taurus TaxID=30522 RepID=A0A4W2HB39_BOBOX
RPGERQRLKLGGAGTLRGAGRGRRRVPRRRWLGAGTGAPRPAREAAPVPSGRQRVLFERDSGSGSARGPREAGPRRAGAPSGRPGRAPLRQYRTSGRGPRGPPERSRQQESLLPAFPRPLRPALRRRVRDRPGADVRAAPGAARTSPERPPRPGPALRRSALPRQAASAHSLPRPSPLSPPASASPSPLSSLSLPLPLPLSLSLSLSPSLSLPSPAPLCLPPSLSLPASSPPVSGAACAQPDCLSKIQSLTFEGRPGCAAPAREAFAVRTHAALAAACPGYRGPQINNTQTMRKIRKRQIKRKECLEQVTYLKELWQRLSRIS